LKVMPVAERVYEIGGGHPSRTVADEEQAVKGFLTSFLEWFGDLGRFCVRLGRAAVSPPYEWKELLRQMDEIGTKSLLPTVIFLSLVKESGPIITALVVSGRVGAGIGAELGSMKVTEQIDA